MDQDNVQVIDATPKDQRKEEEKEKQPIVVIGTEAQSDDMAQEETRVNVALLVHDETRRDPKVEGNLQVPEEDIVLGSLIATYSEKSESHKRKSQNLQCLEM